MKPTNTYAEVEDLMEGKTPLWQLALLWLASTVIVLLAMICIVEITIVTFYFFFWMIKSTLVFLLDHFPY